MDVGGLGERGKVLPFCGDGLDEVLGLHQGCESLAWSHTRGKRTGRPYSEVPFPPLV